MTENIDHERCSELLQSYARSELDAPDDRLVERHLDSCAECRSELHGLRALQAVDTSPLDAREKHRLHAAVDEALTPARDKAAVPAPRPWLQRFAPSLGAAALLLVALVVALNGGTIGGGGDESSPALRERGGGQGADAGGAAPAADSPGAEEKADPPSSAPRDDKADTEMESLESAGTAGAPKPNFRAGLVNDIGELSESKWMQEFAAFYTVADAEKRVDGYLARLSADAPTEARRQVEACGDMVDESAKALLPATGAYGRIANQPSLVLGFVYSDEERGPLNNYMVWAWPRGSCSDRLDYETGPIEN